MTKPSKANMTHQYDIVISGGGIVGCLAACALAQFSHLKIALLEAGQVHANSTQASPIKDKADNSPEHAGFDAKVIALAHKSLSLLAQCGVNIDTLVGEDIRQIHVSDKGHVGQVRLHAKEQGVEQLGKVVAIAELGDVLLSKVKQLSNVDYYCPARINTVDKHINSIDLNLSESNQQETNLHTKLLIVSDGGNSTTRNMLGFTQQQVDYGQSAIISNVQMQLPHNNIAFERFTSQGPIALLPMHSNEQIGSAMSLVWCMHKEKLAHNMALSNSAFLHQLQVLFGHKLGRFVKCSQRFSYPLALNHVSEFVAHRTICIGNAAQSLHPIAGQGFNLGIRDVVDLIHSVALHGDVGTFDAISAYKHLRTQDKKSTITATNTLVNIFSNQYLPLVIGRNAGLVSMNKTSLVKRRLAAFAMGNRP